MSYRDLGAQVEAEWAAARHLPSKFAGIAKKWLKTAPIEEYERERLENSEPNLPYENDNFRIEVRRHISFSTVIRQELFKGVMRVVEGTGLRTIYTFAERREGRGRRSPPGTQPTAQFGMMEQHAAHILDTATGVITVKPVIQSVVALEPRPLVIVVITQNPPRNVVRWRYLRPGVALHNRRAFKEADDESIAYATWFKDKLCALRRARRHRNPGLQFFLALLMTQQHAFHVFALVVRWLHTQTPHGISTTPFQIVANWIEVLIAEGLLHRPDELPNERETAKFLRNSWHKFGENGVTFLLHHVQMPGGRLPRGLPPPV